MSTLNCYKSLFIGGMAALTSFLAGAALSQPSTGGCDTSSFVSLTSTTGPGSIAEVSLNGVGARGANPSGADYELNSCIFDIKNGTTSLISGSTVSRGTFPFTGSEDESIRGLSSRVDSSHRQRYIWFQDLSLGRESAPREAISFPGLVVHVQNDSGQTLSDFRVNFRLYGSPYFGSFQRPFNVFPNSVLYARSELSGGQGKYQGRNG